MAKIKKTKIEDLIPDDLNFNKGTQFGQSMIEKSLRTFGAGRSILLDKNNKIIAGNKTTEGYYAAQLSIETDEDRKAKAVADYKAHLSRVIAIKTMVKNDLLTEGY